MSECKQTNKNLGQEEKCRNMKNWKKSAKVRHKLTLARPINTVIINQGIGVISMNEVYKELVII